MNTLKIIGKIFFAFLFVFVIMHMWCGVAVLESHDWDIPAAYDTLEKTFNGEINWNEYDDYENFDENSIYQ